MVEPLLPREVRRRLAIIQHAEEVTGNVSMTCRYYGISRTVYYRWLRRYQEHGVEGAAGPLAAPAQQPERDPRRCRGQDRLPTAELPLRPRQDRHVPAALPRRGGLPVRDLANPQTSRPQPATGLAALQTPGQALPAV